MWHEARRQGRKLKGMLVDYRKRSERRREYYERIKADPTQFLQIHGQESKIHIDQNVATTAEKALIIWEDNLIDRFDGRVHLDSIPSDYDKDYNEEKSLTQEERQLNYERYRIIAQNSFLKISEEKFLKQIYLEEHDGYIDDKDKKFSKNGAAIGFNYEENSAVCRKNLEDSDEDKSDTDLDVDLLINVVKLDTTQANEINKHGCNYGMSSNDFYSFLINDLEEAETIKLAREEEQEKALFAGRKSRRERRVHRERKLASKPLSPPSYAAKSLISAKVKENSTSRSRSSSPGITEKITYITSFEADEESSIKKSPSKKLEPRKIISSFNVASTSKKYNTPTTSKNQFRRCRSRCRRCRSSSKLKYRRNRSANTSTSSSRDRNRLHKSRVQYRFFERRNISSTSTSSGSTSKNSSRRNSPDKYIGKSARPRYYGRKKSDSSLDSTDVDIDKKTAPKRDSLIKKSTTNSIIARLKKKLQVSINKQYRADKIAEQEKTIREKLEQQAREDRLKEISIKLRKRQREMRHANELFSSTDSNLSDRSDHSFNGKKRDHSSYGKRSRGNCKSSKERSVSRDRHRGEKEKKSKKSKCSLGTFKRF